MGRHISAVLKQYPNWEKAKQVRARKLESGEARKLEDSENLNPGFRQELFASQPPGPIASQPDSLTCYDAVKSDSIVNVINTLSHPIEATI